MTGKFLFSFIGGLVCVIKGWRAEIFSKKNYVFSHAQKCQFLLKMELSWANTNVLFHEKRYFSFPNCLLLIYVHYTFIFIIVSKLFSYGALERELESWMNIE